ncbi:MAG: NRDE family protein [Burkholderiaceae bacterium]
MCLVGLAIDENRRFPLVIAANRDEFFDRPAARLAWWQPAEGGPQILAGRDLSAGGTWLGLSAAGRLALVTNVRRIVEPDPHAPSRGGIVPRWLRTELRPDQFWMQTSLSGYAPFNLIAADFRRGECFWASNEQAIPRRIERGIFGLSNAALDTPWPKVEALKARLGEALDAADSVDALSSMLFAALSDRGVPPDDRLPNTGIGRERERVLAPAFVRTPDGRYGTRCSTVIVTEKIKRQLVTHVFERTFTAGPGVALLRRAVLKDWPPRYADRAASAVEISAVAETELEPGAAIAPMPPLPAKRTRVRSLLKPASK